MSEMERLADNIAALQAAMTKLTEQVGMLVAKAHTPSDCPLAAQVQRLTIREARQAGMLAVVGTIAIIVGGGIMSLVSRLWTVPK